MGRCGGGAGPNAFDPVAALEQWVEQGRAPASIIAILRNGDGPTLFRKSTRDIQHKDLHRGEGERASRPAGPDCFVVALAGVWGRRSGRHFFL
jgi:hypothetical protein